MKSKIHEFQANNFFTTSKKSIIYLSIAIVTFSNVALALSSQQSFNDEYLSLTQTLQTSENTTTSTGNDSIEKVTGKEEGGNPTTDIPETIFNPYAKSIEEIISENSQIIEDTLSKGVVEKESEVLFVDDNQIIDVTIASEIDSLCSKKTVDEIIIEDSQITESPFLKEVQPINSVKIK